MPELKPCPFCDADPYSIRVETFGIKNQLHRAGCGACLAEGPLCGDEEEAVAAWNVRPDEARIRRETINECVSVLIENAKHFTGIGASVAGALHAAARELLDMNPSQREGSDD